MEEELKCPICFTLAETPFESNCCGNIFCDICVGILKRNEEHYKCPICRKNVTFRESSFARRLLTNLVVKCSYKCGESLLFHKMKQHMKVCPEREYYCKIDEKCKFKAKRDEFLQHIVSQHPLVLLNVAENFSRVREYLPELEVNEKKFEKKDKLRDEVNQILSEYNHINRENTDPYDLNYNYAVSNIDRSFYRNYLFRRRLLNSESSRTASVHENENISVHSQSESFNNNNNFLNRSNPRKTDNTPTQNNSTNLFKYYLNEYNDLNDQNQQTDNIYSKFDPVNADEDDYKNLYQQLVSQNRLLKSEVLDKIKKHDDSNTLLTFSNYVHSNHQNQMSGGSSNNAQQSSGTEKVEEEEKENERQLYSNSKREQAAGKTYNSISIELTPSTNSNCILNQTNKLLNTSLGNKDKGNNITSKFDSKEQSNSINTTSSLCLNIDNKANI